MVAGGESFESLVVRLEEEALVCLQARPTDLPEEIGDGALWAATGRRRLLDV